MDGGGEIYELKRVKAKRQHTSWWAIMLYPISLNKFILKNKLVKVEEK